MYWLKETKLSVPEHIQSLIETHNIKNIKYVLVNKLSIEKEITVDNVKIKPNKTVLPNYFWFIQGNKPKK